MADNTERIEELRYQIDKLSPMIEKELAAINEESTFAEKLAANVNANALEGKRQELNELLAEQQENNLELHLTGEEIEYGIAPVDTISETLTAFQKLLQRFLQSDVEIEPSKKISDNIQKATQLKCIAFAPGSFKVRVAGPTEDDGMFYKDKNMSNNRVFRKIVQEIFDVMSEPDSAESIKRVKSKGTYALKAYRDFMDNGRKHKLNVVTTWFKQNAPKVNTISSNQFESTLKQIEEYYIKKTQEVHRGIFVGLNIEKLTFDFASEIHPQTIHGTFSKDLLETLTKLRVSPVDNVIYNVTINKTIDGTKQKADYQLLSIEPDKRTQPSL